MPPDCSVERGFIYRLGERNCTIRLRHWGALNGTTRNRNCVFGTITFHRFLVRDRTRGEHGVQGGLAGAFGVLTALSLQNIQASPSFSKFLSYSILFPSLSTPKFSSPFSLANPFLLTNFSTLPSLFHLDGIPSSLHPSYQAYFYSPGAAPLSFFPLPILFSPSMASRSRYCCAVLCHLKSAFFARLLGGLSTSCPAWLFFLAFRIDAEK